LAKIVVEIGEEASVGAGRIEIAELEPLRGEARDERLGARVGQHAAGLPRQLPGLTEAAALREVEQLVVRDAAPEEKGQARGELEVAQAVGGLRRQSRRITLDAEEELVVHENGAERDPAG